MRFIRGRNIILNANRCGCNFEEEIWVSLNILYRALSHLPDFNSMSDLGSRMSKGRPADIFDREQWARTHETLPNIEDIISDVVWMLDTFQRPRNSNSAPYLRALGWNSFTLWNSYVPDRFDRHLLVSSILGSYQR